MIRTNADWVGAWSMSMATGLHAGGSQDDRTRVEAVPLAYGVPSACSGFLDKLPTTPAADSAASDRRCPAADLGDFISFDEVPDDEGIPSVANNAGGTSVSSERARAEHWCPTRKYNGPSWLLRLHEELLDFASAFRPTCAERATRQQLVSRVKDLLHTIWPDAEVRAFGSFDTGLYLPESDIDLVCLGTGATNQKQKGRALYRISEMLRRAAWRAAKVEVVDKARVPIIKFVDVESGVAVDICLEETTGLQSSQLARKAAEKYACIRMNAILACFAQAFTVPIVDGTRMHNTLREGCLTGCVSQPPPLRQQNAGSQHIECLCSSSSGGSMRVACMTPIRVA